MSNLSGSGTLRGAVSGGGGTPTPTDVYWDDILDKPDFAEVATSGSYNDLLDKPNIPVYTAGNGITIENGVISATSSGGDTLEYKPAYILFKDGYKNNFIETLIPQLDLEYYIDFYIDTYQNDKAILGNSDQAARIHLTMYNNKWYTSSGSGEINFGDSSMITGRHNFRWNESGTHKILFDNVEVSTCNQYIDNEVSIRLNNRTGTMCCANSRIYEFKITDHSGVVLHDFKPFAIYKNGVLVDKRVIDIAGGMNVGAGYYDVIEEVIKNE